MKKYFESDEILAMVWKWRKHLIVVFIVSTLGAVLFSSPWFIKPKFKSFAVGYPANLKPYSEESPSEQMLQLLESDSIRKRLVSKFDLYKHYDIDVDGDHKLFKLIETIEENVEFKKTKHESVLISVLDVSPDTAYLMVREIIEGYNGEVKRMQDGQLIEAVRTIKFSLDLKRQEVHRYESELDTLRLKHEILDYGSQVKNLSKEYYKLMARKSDPSKLEKVKQELDILKSKGGEFQRVSVLLSNARRELADLSLKYEQQNNELKRKRSYFDIAIHPHIADKKVYPVRWLILVATVGISMVLAFGAISMIERFEKKVKG